MIDDDQIEGIAEIVEDYYRAIDNDETLMLNANTVVPLLEELCDALGIEIP